MTLPPTALHRLAARFLTKVQPDPSGVCWVWMGALDEDGYGNFYAPGFTKSQRTKAHRVSIWLFRGIDPGVLPVHHTCSFRNCVNPYHLEAMTPTAHRAEHRRLREEELCTLSEATGGMF